MDDSNPFINNPDDFLNEVERIAGINARKVAEFLLNQKDMMASNEEIAKELSMDLDLVRDTLYKLADSGFVEFDRQRNKETGWFIFLWKLRRIR